jgi:two-component system chemotaxis response regulator CheY
MTEEERRKSERAAAKEAERLRLVEQSKGRAEDTVSVMLKEYLLEDIDENTEIRKLKGLLPAERVEQIEQEVARTKSSRPPGPITKPVRDPARLADSRAEPSFHPTIPSPPPKMTPPKGGIPIPVGAHRSPPPSGDRILVVDDDKDIRETLTETLRAEGYHVLAAADGWEASIAVMQEARIDVILLDWMMPRVNGAEFLTWLNRSPWSHIPVLIITAGRPPEDVADAFVFVKPLQLDRLLETVRTSILEHRQVGD